VLGWALIALAVVLLIAFVGSRWKRLEVRWTLGASSRRVIIGGGTAGYYWMNSLEPAGVDFDSSPSPRWHLWSWWWDDAPKGWSPPRLQCGGPLWPAVVVLGAGGVGLVWWGRRVRLGEGVCARCGYEVRGLSVCPECGARTRATVD
jgi:hypothetical protein